MLVDKNAILQIIGCLMKNPMLLGETDKYFLTPQDFNSTFEKYIFSAIFNLFQNGAEKIGVQDIDNYLISHPAVYRIFENGKGIEWLQDAEEISQLENFKYYYNRVKKLNCLKDLKKLGYNINHIYTEDLISEESRVINDRFELLSVSDIFNLIKTDLAKVEEVYAVGSNSDSVEANHEIKRLIQEFKNSPEVGVSCQGEIFNTIVRGGRKGKFYLRSGGTGSGKTRSLVGDACYMAYPIRYNSLKRKWELNGNSEKVLYIATEQDFEEIQTLILSYLTDINEEVILYGQYGEEEERLLSQAAEIMDTYKSNFQLVRMSDPNIGSLKATIRKHYLVNNIENVFYDYIFSSPALLNEFRDLRIREDVVLCMLSTSLKDLAVEMNLFIMSSTQVNGDLEEKKGGIKNQSCLRGAKAIADKVDVGCITMKITEEEMNILSKLTEKFDLVPNQVTDIYKVRRGRYVDVRIWSHMDLGTCRKKDLFITDARFNKIEGFQVMSFIFGLDTLSEYDKILSLYNNIENKLDVLEVKENIKLKEIKPTIKINGPADWGTLL